MQPRLNLHKMFIWCPTCPKKIFNFSKSTTETLEKSVKYVQS